MTDNIRRKINKTIKILLIVIILIGTIRYLLESYPYSFYRPQFHDNAQNTIHSLGRFLSPANYKIKSVDRSSKGENVLGIYVNEQTGQKLIISVLREHLPDKLDKIQILDRTQVQRTFAMDSIEITKVVSFRFTYLLPFIRKDDLSGMGDEAIVKGITIKRQERFETAFADILYVNGEFTKIGLYKERKGIWNYPTPVFDFKSIHDGALAFVKSKKSGKVYVCVSANGIGKYHDEEFQSFLKSFEPE